MKAEEGGERMRILEQTLKEITKVYQLANPDGIKSIRFLNGEKGKRNVKSNRVKDLLKDHRFRGVTRIGTQLEKKVLDRFVWNRKEPMKKPLLVMTITDGAVRSPGRTLPAFAKHKLTIFLRWKESVKDFSQMSSSNV